MNKKYLISVIVFSVLLLVPFGVQAVADLRGEKRFQPFDIFKDVVYTPIVREKKVAAAADSLDVKWRAARESIAAGTETADALEPVTSSLSDLEAAVLSVNTYAELDTTEARYKSLKLADTLLSKLEDEPESFPQADSCIKALVADLGHVSLWRAFLDVKHYGVWTSRYLRAFENKIDDESAIVLALRPKYQLAVWNLFSDPGEKVVLGAAGDCIGKSCGREEAKPEDKWLFYRQDVEFLVQPSPLDVRSAKLDNPVMAIEKFRDQLKAKGVELLVVITPGKPSIYTERLTGRDENAAGLQSHGKKILDSLTRAGFNTVDLYTSLLAAKSRDSVEGALYLNDDTHWTPRGAELAADVIAKKVREMVDAGTVKFRGKDTVRYVASDSLADRMGDVGEMSGLNKFGVFKVQKVTGHVVMQQNIKIRDEELPEDTVCIDSAYKECMNRKKADKKDGKTTDVLCLLTSQTDCAIMAIKYDTTITPFKDDFRKSEILILGDSFSRIYQTDSPVNAGWIAHFAKNMNRPVASIVSDGGASTLVREKLARKASVLKGKKLLIWEFVERDLRFGAEGWKDVNF
ncbi:alginate O-acetyltransferase AlgX-related protein [Fibrobacter succinogenes]|uniref:SGNH hydrolase-like domain-containing protein, acetyltransferase AlgX n=1 Tax=Fibrobacter succinogenes TaxID=833 RepID=A0A380RWF0_FIBSU|nr:hypothetical protein [Fibrobacter succinogenes]PWJ37362.1 acetyltransferase AlgX (SGNH hydrolase-like protein) [Fibrobacter succinogenes subsp. elongatus]SUQ19609.1 SGNH hydrolase-like domain-containing protein, acetyltransferase AlgX [Fibrobacter succinogenes]